MIHVLGGGAEDACRERDQEMYSSSQKIMLVAIDKAHHEEGNMQDEED